MREYQAPAPEIAALVHEKNAECDQARQRLHGKSVDEAWAIANDTSESAAARLESILKLLRKKDSRIPDLILSLFDESDITVWRAAIRSIHPDDPRIRQRLRERASCNDIDGAAEALCVLAHMRDGATIVICKEWLTGSQVERNVAVEALRILRTDEARKILNDRWHEPLTDEDRHTLALVLVEFDHFQAIEHVDEMAQSAADSWSVAAATRLYYTNKKRGLRRMLNILQNGKLEAQQSMVLQISSLMCNLPHSYTADGIHEARLWIETQLAEAS